MDLKRDVRKLDYFKNQSELSLIKFTTENVTAGKGKKRYKREGK